MRPAGYRTKVWLTIGVVATASAGVADGAAAAKRCGGKAVTKQGTSGDDVIEGTDRTDVVWAGAGDDHIDTLGGDDIICAGRGRDVVLAGMSDDWIEGGAGNDRITAGRGHDFVAGEDGADRIDGGDQSDEVHGHAGPDFIDIGNSATARGNGDVGYGGLGRDTLKATGDGPFLKR